MGRSPGAAVFDGVLQVLRLGSISGFQGLFKYFSDPSNLLPTTYL